MSFQLQMGCDILLTHRCIWLSVPDMFMSNAAICKVL